MSVQSCRAQEKAVELTMKQKNKVEIIQRVMARKLSVSEAARVLGRCERTIYRCCRRLDLDGLEGLLHGNQGRRSERRLSESTAKKILTLVAKEYRDINDTHLRELLEKHHAIRLGRETLRALLRKAGVAPKRKRRSPKYRARRERKEAFGMMLQIDASIHRWLEARGPRFTLVGAKDDATSFVWARFVEAETTWSYLELLRRILETHGVPLSLYSDRHTIFHILREPTIVEQLKDIQPLSQFGRAMDELGIHIIKAYTPQAKGRIERQWGVFQDRLVVELRLANAKTMADANRVLEGFLVDYNRRFSLPARNQTPLFRTSPASSVLDRIFCIKQTRVVQKDHTISVDGLILQIPPSTRFRSIAGRKVDVLQQRDTSLQVIYRGSLAAVFSAAAITRLLSSRIQPTELRKAS